MSYLDKCIKTKEMARICYDNGIYDSCVNRYYYSFYQELMHKLQEKKIKVEATETNGGSHVKTFNTFKRYLKDVKRIKMTRITAINSDFIRFKKLREKADYNQEMLSKEEADKAIGTYNSLKKEFKSL
ncbi:hypothetical protein QTI77_14605 [Clostridium perfringens]|nr:hypothetical protein [Clostridium perfringens]MDK0751005.1 hypothetical protein [Clostridium perfringens]MDK0796642.1 hypothetical protein [Clostridium perfringens]MDM0889260.1 hypothetical protein [Clostridium perfringens]MDM0901097.1 hypothetical protein [Clostridium perfringens]